MDQAGKYELLIGEKLEQIPLPDLVEAIWARIESELDTDLPDGDDNGPDAGPVGGIFGGRSLFILIGALIMAFFFYPNNKKQNIESNIVLPRIETIAPINKPPDKSPPITNRPNRSGSSKQEAKDSSSSFAPPELTQQSSAPPSNTLDDSVQSNVPSLVVTPPPLVVKDTSKRKGRGVKGLSDEDYRIVPKKER